MTFHVGQKVVCVDAGGVVNAKPLKLRGIYTIRGIYNDEVWGIGISVEEIINPEYSPGKEFGYRTRRFRPLVERKTSIEIFTAMLNPSKQGVDA